MLPFFYLLIPPPALSQAEEAILQQELGLLVRLTTSSTSLTAAERVQALMEPKWLLTTFEGRDREWYAPLPGSQHPAVKADLHLHMNDILSRLEV